VKSAWPALIALVVPGLGGACRGADEGATTSPCVAVPKADALALRIEAATPRTSSLVALVTGAGRMYGPPRSWIRELVSCP